MEKKRKNNIKPTVLQIEATKHILAGEKTVAGAMRKAGYDETSIKNPKSLTESVGFKQILAQAGVTEEKLSKVLHDGLEAKTKDSKPDHAVRHRFLETGLRVLEINGSDPDAPVSNVQNNFIIAGEELRQQFADDLRKKIFGGNKENTQSNAGTTSPDRSGDPGSSNGQSESASVDPS